jgi:hypothetical protein
MFLVAAWLLYKFFNSSGEMGVERYTSVEPVKEGIKPVAPTTEKTINKVVTTDNKKVEVAKLGDEKKITSLPAAQKIKPVTTLEKPLQVDRKASNFDDKALTEGELFLDQLINDQPIEDSADLLPTNTNGWEEEFGCFVPEISSDDALIRPTVHLESGTRNFDLQPFREVINVEKRNFTWGNSTIAPQTRGLVNTGYNDKDTSVSFYRQEGGFE